MKHKLLATLLLATTVIVTACEQQATASQYEQNVAALKAECEQLSQDTGRDYKPLIGKYLVSKSSPHIVAGETTYYSFRMVFEVDRKEITIIDSFTETEQSYDDFYQNLKSVVGENHFGEDKEDPKEDFGICALENGQNKFSADSKYLRKLGDPD